MRRARCPVMIVSDGALDDVERPVVDGATVVCGIGTRSDLTVARVAARLASALDIRLRLAHVLAPMHPLVVPPMAGVVPPGVPAAGVVPDSRNATALLRWVADEIRERHPELAERIDWRLISGRPGEGLARLGITSHAAAVVVGTAGHGALGGAVSGSPAWTLARVATVPVMVCRDEGETMA
jgi:nucleotide-binding universal stress UspA family protein